MKKVIFFIVTILCISCSKDEENTVQQITILSSEKVRIGDTIVLSGQGMDKIHTIVFKNRFQEIYASHILVSNELIKVVVPKLSDENFKLYLKPNSTGHNLLNFKLIGTFPLPRTTFSNESELKKIRMIDENIAFLITQNKLYKTINGGYNWTTVKAFNSNISGMCFLNENQGWVSLGNVSGLGSQLYFTNDGGSTFNAIFTLNDSGKSITEIYFSSQNNGYLLTMKGEIYKTSDNSNFELAYDYPNSNEESNGFEFDRLSGYNNNLIATGQQSNQQGFIRKINNNYDYIPSSNSIINVQLINESQAYLVINATGGSELFFTNNFDSNWQETSNQKINNIHFVNKNKGIGVSYSEYSNSHVISETYDGGENWINQFDLYNYSTDVDFYNNVGLITGKSGLLWKHIYE